MILVTGANGFIGSQLVRALNERDRSDIIVTDYVDPADRPQPLNQSQYHEFSNPDQLWKNIDSYNFTVIFHIGACSSTTETNWDYLKKVNLEYSQRLFEYATEKQIPFYYASSGAVYGDGSLGFDDSTPPERFKPLNLYGKSKSLMDIWALKQPRTPPRWAGFRYFNVYGPNEYHKDSMSSLVYKAFHQIKDTGSLALFKSHKPEYKDGHQKRDFVYVKDITDWMLDIWKAERFDSGIYNMGQGKAQTWLDLAEATFLALDKPLKINWIDIPENIRNQYQYFTEAKMDRLHKQGFSSSKWSLKDGVTDYVMNYLRKLNA